MKLQNLKNSLVLTKHQRRRFNEIALTYNLKNIFLSPKENEYILYGGSNAHVVDTIRGLRERMIQNQKDSVGVSAEEEKEEEEEEEEDQESSSDSESTDIYRRSTGKVIFDEDGSSDDEDNEDNEDDENDKDEEEYAESRDLINTPGAVLSSPKTILLVGIVQRKNPKEITHIRDQIRIDELKHLGYEVFSISTDADNYDSEKHFLTTMNKRGAVSLCKNLPENVLFDFILIDYVRFPSAYYDQLIIGTKNGRNVIEFIQVLQQRNKLNSNCAMFFAPRMNTPKFSLTLEHFQQNLGKTIKVNANNNPLYIATDNVQNKFENTVLPGGFNHRNELFRLLYGKTPYGSVHNQQFYKVNIEDIRQSAGTTPSSRSKKTKATSPQATFARKKTRRTKAAATTNAAAAASSRVQKTKTTPSFEIIDLVDDDEMSIEPAATSSAASAAVNRGKISNSSSSIDLIDLVDSDEE